MSKTSENEDCWPCRLTSGFGAMAIGAYLYSQSHKQNKIGKGVLIVLSAGAVGVGVARLFNMRFLKAETPNRTKSSGIH